MLPIKMRRLPQRNKKLRPRGILPSIGHTHDTRLIVFQNKIFIGEFPVEGFTTGTVKVLIITPLDHEAGYDAVEYGVVIGFGRFGGGGTEGKEVGACFGTGLCV